jgi:copper chaperone CopZ
MNPATIELTAPDISCEKCKATIEGDLAGEPGIGQVTADVGTRQVRITYDREHTSPERLRARLSEIGYPAAPLSRWPILTRRIGHAMNDKAARLT